MSFNPFDLLSLVNDFGETVTLRKKTTQGTYDTDTGIITGSATTDYSTIAYFYSYENGVMVNTDEVRRGTRKCIIPALGLAVEPDSEDQVIGTLGTGNILSVVTIFSSGTPICYLCDVRGQ